MTESATRQYSSYDSTCSSPYIYDSTDHSYIPREKKPRQSSVCLLIDVIHNLREPKSLEFYKYLKISSSYTSRWSIITGILSFRWRNSADKCYFCDVILYVTCHSRNSVETGQQCIHTYIVITAPTSRDVKIIHNYRTSYVISYYRAVIRRTL